MQKLEVVYLKTADLIPYARNSRTHSDEQVAQIAGSIKEFGFTNPILIDEENGIIAGHGRLKAAGLLKLPEVPTITLAGLTKGQRKAYIIADNKLALNAGWDIGLLSIDIQELSEEGFDLALTGFSPEELIPLLRDIAEADLPDLNAGDREPYQQMAFKLHDDQVAEVERALDAAHKLGPYDESINTNKNANALARICEVFVTSHG